MMQRRKNYFIKKAFQVNFLSRFSILLVLEALLIGGLFMLTATNTITTGYSNSTLKIESTTNYFLASFLFIAAIAIVGIGIIGMAVFIYLSHRIAGPLYKFEKVLKTIEEGDLTARISLRRTDQVMEIKDALNKVVESLDKRVARIKEALNEIRDLLPKRDDPGTVSRLSKTVDVLKNEVEHFKVTSSPKG